MAYDEDLADRIRDQLGGDPAVTEKKMFGGLAFLVSGNMAIAASGQGGLLARIDPADADALIETTGVAPAEMRGRVMTGWLRVAPEQVATTAQLTAWVDRCVAFTRSLP